MIDSPTGKMQVVNKIACDDLGFLPSSPFPLDTTDLIPLSGGPPFLILWSNPIYYHSTSNHLSHRVSPLQDSSGGHSFAILFTPFLFYGYRFSVFDISPCLQFKDKNNGE